MQLEPMRPAHAAELFVWMRDPALYRFLPQAPPHDVAALATTLRRWTGGAPSPRERWWNWVVRTSDTPGAPIVGHVQLTFTLSSDVLVAWVFAPFARGRGLATEAVTAALQHVCDLPHPAETLAVAFVDTLNEPSVALAERLGLRRVPHRAAIGTISPGELRFERALDAFAAAATPERRASAYPSAGIRAATDADHATLRAFQYAMWVDIGVDASAFHDDWERRFDERSATLAREASLQRFIAERDGRAVGCASMHAYEGISPPLLKRRTAHLWGIYVVPEARGAGLGRALTQACIAHAREIQCSRAVLHASSAGRDVYKRLGFRASNEMLLELE